MAAASYVPGGWLGLVRSGTAVILDPATPAPLVSSVWDLLAGAPDPADVLHAVTGGFDAPLSATPCFGIIGYSDSLRVFLRGDIDLTVQLPSGPVTLDGRNVTTWAERWLEAPEWFSVAVPGAAAVHQGVPELLRVPELPVVEGAVLLQSLRVSVTDPGGGLPDLPETAAPPLEASAETLVVPGEETVTGFTETGAATSGTWPREARPEEALSGKVLPEEIHAPEAPAQEEREQDESPATEFTSSYDHLWDKTVVRRIEDAAVRSGDEDDDGAPAAPEAAAREVPGQETEGREPEGQESPGQESAAERAAAPQPPVPAQTGLIESVPWATGGDGAPEPRNPASVPGLQVPTSVPGPQIPPSFPAPGSPPSFTGLQVPPSFIPAAGPGAPGEGDHDGQTIFRSDLSTSGAQAGQGQEPGQGAGTPGGENVPGNGPLVLARVCPGGHANPPTSSQCFTCGAQLPDVAVQVPRPRLGRLRLSTGELIDLDDSLVIGRQPSVSRVQGGTMPRLVQVPSPGGDISRSHVEVRLEGWHVMLCDLKATNGTVLVREGQPPRRLAQNEMAIVLDGDIAELGDDVSLRFEEIL
ncbi:FHA domain-containing protein [Arthrobacter globiformis]|uniref:FHA domain-containing protein n=1 Tax=Arthrobacter globiformis TaxID=1665 RepID=UPI000B4075EA|nr:FHA domain-containing protein [Arthrobacter globiformis]